MIAAVRRFVVAAVLVAGAAVGLSSCATPRNALGTASDACLRALAIAPTKVPRPAAFSGVRFESARSIRQALHAVDRHATLPAAVVHNTKAVCSVELTGHFVRSGLQSPWPPTHRAGRYTVVILVASTNHLLVTVLANREPFRIRRF